jgi:hypothetical protein
MEVLRADVAACLPINLPPPAQKVTSSWKLRLIKGEGKTSVESTESWFTDRKLNVYEYIEYT